MKSVAVAIALASFAMSNAVAQSYPTRAVRLVTPYAPGGGTDIIARAIAQKMTETLGQSVVVENRTGGGGIVGTEVAAKAPADGYTLLMGTTGPLALNPHLYAKLPYDTLRDFIPIILVAKAQHMLAVHPSVPAKSVKELIAFAKANPDKLTFSSGGAGGSSQLSGELFKLLAGVKMLHVPYRGTGPAAVAVVTGEVGLSFVDVLTTLPHVKSGRVRGLAVSGATRTQVAPELPTIAEAGLKGYESGVWYGVLAPAKTPRDVVTRLNAELSKILRDPAVRSRLAAEGSDVAGGTPEEFADYIQLELGRWGRVVKVANVRLE
jgi:tripartite-type tricarboxylate transporter receptor subunit TctC